MLTGRAEPMRVLRAALDDAREGRGRLALLCGEAGIGKSTMALSLANVAGERGADVTWGRAWEFADAPPYFPVRPCLRSIGLDDRAHHDDAFGLWESVIATLAASAQSRVVVWIVEDVHAADIGTLDLLAFLAQPLRGLRALVVATVRANDPRIDSRVAQRISRMERDGLAIRLTSLGDDDVASLAEATLGRTIGPDARRRLVELTGGNPLFVIECARAFRAAGGGEKTVGALPTTVRQVVLERVEHLPDTTRETLACGAILGREFSAASAARMQGMLPARAIDTLLVALRAGIVTETAPGRFMFSHGIVRDAVEDSLPAHERAKKHARAEAALAAQGDAIEVVVERARHAIEALPECESTRVSELVTRASRMLEAQRAFERAFVLRLRLDVARSHGLFPAPSLEERLELAALARAAGRSDVTRRECEQLFVLAREAGDSRTFARAVLLHASDVRPGVVDRSQVALIEHALASVAESEEHESLRCRLRARYATALQPADDQDAVMAIAQAALDEARRTGDDATIREVLEQMPWGLYYAPLAARIELMTELRDRALRADDRPQALRAFAALTLCRVEAADFAAFDRETASMLALSREVGNPRDRWRALLLASMRALAAGDFAESDRHFTEAAQLAAVIDDAAFPLALAMHDVFRKRFQRRDAEALAALAVVERHIHDVAEPALQMAVIRGACAARREDREETQRALATLAGRPPLVWSDPNFVALLAEAHALAGRDDERRTMFEHLGALDRVEVAPDPVAFVHEGAVTRLLGLLAASLG